jgi:hypothetical protein
MDQLFLSQQGKKRTILISISILLLSIYTIYAYHAVRPQIEFGKLTQQGIRFLLTLGLLYALYIGKDWAINLMTILFSIAILMSILGLINIDRSLIIKSPLLVMIFVYAMAIYHFKFSLSYKAFIESQKTLK